MPGVSLISHWEIWSYPRLLLRLLRDLRSVSQRLGASYARVLTHVARLCLEGTPRSTTTTEGRPGT
jgi:hypothetical protein